MFEGKTFLPVTGTPIRKMACMMRPLADADPVPLAVAILKAKSLTRSIRYPSGSTGTLAGCCTHPDGSYAFTGCNVPARGSSTANLRMSHAYVGQRSAHRPQ